MFKYNLNTGYYLDFLLFFLLFLPLRAEMVNIKKIDRRLL